MHVEQSCGSEQDLLFYALICVLICALICALTCVLICALICALIVPLYVPLYVSLYVPLCVWNRAAAASRTCSSIPLHVLICALICVEQSCGSEQDLLFWNVETQELLGPKPKLNPKP